MKYQKPNLKDIGSAIIIIIFVGCLGNKNKGEVDSRASLFPLSNNANELEINDLIDTSFSGLEYLFINKDDDIIKLNFKLTDSLTSDSLTFQHNDFSEVVFPKKSVAILGDVDFTTQRFYVSEKLILVLPLIGVNNKLQIYFIDLRNKKIVNADIRTFFELVWINPQTQLMYTSNFPEYLDSTIIYKINEYSITTNGFEFKRNYTIETKNNIEDSSNYQFGLISKLK